MASVPADRNETLQEALDHLGRGRFSETRRLCDGLLATAPDDADALHLSALAMFRQGEGEAAIDRLVRAIELQPQNADMLANLGLIQFESGQFEAAAACLAASVDIVDNDPFVRLRMALALQRSGHIDDAETAYRDLIRLAPTFAPAHYNLGTLFEMARRPEQALAEFETAARLDPAELSALSSAAHLRQILCQWDGIDRLRTDLVEKALATPNAERPPAPLDIVGLPVHVTPAERRALTSIYARARAMGASPQFSAAPARPAGRRLRIGYLSSDFGDHPVGHIVNGLIARHDRSAFEVTAYATTDQRPGAGVEQVVDLSTLDPGAAARRIHTDAIDVLIDLNGYTFGNRLDIVARRPARVHATWLGFPGTLGTNVVDAILVDPVIAPPGDQPHYAERLVHLPNCYFAVAAAPTPPPSRRAAGLPEHGVVFAAFSASYKIEPLVFGAWMRVLAAVPDSVLWLRIDQDTALANLRREAQARGVDPARLINAPRLSRADHLARQGCVDLMLDTLYYGAHATAANALAAGVPMITCAGDGFASRVGASLVRAAGLPELAASDPGGYEALAVHLARDAGARAELKGKLLAAHKTAPLFDLQRFVRDLEAVYRELLGERRPS